MRKIDKIYYFIFRKDIIIYSISIIVFISLNGPIESLLSNTIVKYAFSHINSIWYNDIVFLIVTLAAIFLTVYRFKRYTPSLNITAVLIIATVIYIIYRSTGVTWEFTSLYTFSFFKYADILIIISLCQLLLFIKKEKEEKKNGKNSFFEDQPLGENGTDELGYNSYADLLGNKILSSQFSKSFAIGINGKWGLGKTSFIDLLKRKIKGKNIIEINFNPWNSHSPKAIIKDFFETVQETIHPYHSSLSRRLIQYSNKLVALNSNTVTQSIQTTVAAITGFDSINSLYDEIDKALIKIKKKIVIYIDDLDRLDQFEIIEVIRLIRNTANFHNTIFIVAYDRNYVINALKQHNPYKQEEFLEKIFQIEVTLPYFKKDILRYKLFEKLKEKLPEVLHNTINEKVIGSPSIVPIFLNEWLESMRDVTRLANALFLNLNKLIGEVEFSDFLRMELLRLKYPSVYELLFRRTSDFLDTFSQSGKKQQYKLKSIDEKQKTNLESAEKLINKELGLYLVRNHTELSIPKNAISKIVDFIDGIFNGGLSYSISSRSHLSIIYPSKFNRYFAYTLLEGNLSEIEFSEACSLNQKDFDAKLTDWVNRGFEYELKNRFSEIKYFDSRDDFEKVIRAIFHLANQPTKNSNLFLRNLVGYDGKDIVDKLSNYENKLIKQYYPENDGFERLRTFIKSLFKSAKSPFSFESDLLRYFNDQYTESFPLTKEELKEMSVGYLHKYCLEVDRLDSNVWHLFHSCKQTDWIPTGANSATKQEILPEEAKLIMKDFLLNKDIDGFLLAIIKTKPFDQMKFAISDVIIELFGNWKAFEDVLAKKDEESSKYLKEFKLFLAEFASKNYSRYVDFNFETIQI